MDFQMQATSTDNVKDITIDDNIVHGSGVDSGYSSQGSPTVISPNLSIQYSSSVSHLQPIYENVELKSFLSSPEGTPSTQNIQGFINVHMTTPTSSLKQSAICVVTTNVSQKKTHLDAREQSKSYRNIIDNIHVDDENSENYYAVVAELSPIKSMGNVLKERNSNVDGKARFSSTPINEEVFTKSKCLSKTGFFNPVTSRVFCKIQNLKPSKTVRVKHTSDEIRVLQKTANTPRKLIDFSPKKFQVLVKGYDKSSTVVNVKTVDDRSKSRHKLKSYQTNASLFSGLQKLNRQNDNEELTTPANSIDIVYEPSTSKDVILEDYSSRDLSNNNHLNITKSISEIAIESSIIYKLASPIKSIKKTRRDLRSQHSPKKELRKIVFSKIPYSTPALKAPIAAECPLLTKRKSYARLKRFDILSHLAETTTATIQIILKNLSPKDINVMYNVSRTWRAIVLNDAAANRQRKKYFHTLFKNKENLQQKKPLKTVPLDGYRKSPLKRSNSVNVSKKPLVVDAGQSKLDNPILLINEMKNLFRVQCPYCCSPSMVSKQLINEPQMNNEDRIPFQRNFFADCELSEYPPKPNKSQIDFAECTKKSCGFKFCLKCLCAYHNNTKCPIEPSSPTKPSDWKLLYPTGSRSKRNLRRLCSLDKF